MKKIMLIFAIILLVASVNAEMKEAPLQGVVMGSGWLNNNSFNDANLGVSAGFQTSVDADRSLWMRIVYSQWQLHPDDSKSITTSTLMDWYLGSNWKFYVDLGAEHFISGYFQGSDYFGGLGFSKRLYTGKENYQVPFHADGFLEFKYADGSDETGNYAQINLGLKFGKPVK